MDSLQVSGSSEIASSALMFALTVPSGRLSGRLAIHIDPLEQVRRPATGKPR
jgi:hypothetical protein